MARKQLSLEIEEEVWNALHEMWRKMGAKRGGKRQIVEMALRKELALPIPAPEEDDEE